MRVLLIGSTGTIGREIAKKLERNHELITASRSNPELSVDIAEPASVEAMFRKVERIDAVISAAGAATFKTLADLTDEDFYFSFKHKLMGQINLVRIGQRYVSDNGSFTLTSGVLAREPMPGSCAISMVNAGLEGFVRAAQLEMERGLRVNVVSPIWVSETLATLGRDPGIGMPALQVASAYMTCLTGIIKGAVLDVRDYA